MNSFYLLFFAFSFNSYSQDVIAYKFFIKSSKTVSVVLSETKILNDHELVKKVNSCIEDFDYIPDAKSDCPVFSPYYGLLIENNLIEKKMYIFDFGSGFSHLCPLIKYYTEDDKVKDIYFKDVYCFESMRFLFNEINFIPTMSALLY